MCSVSSLPSREESDGAGDGENRLCLRSFCVGDVTNGEVSFNILKAAGTSL